MKIALVGCGNWGQHILRDLRILDPKMEIAVVARSTESKKRAMDGGADHVVDDEPDIAKVMSPDGVIVASPSSTHAATAAEVLGLFNVPVFIEKPLATSVKDVETLLDFPEHKIFVMDKWRYHPGIEALRDIARSGELGEVIGLRTARVGWGDLHSDSDAVWHLAPHDLAIGLEIMGFLPEVPRHAAVDHDRAGQCTGVLAIMGTKPWLAFEVSNRSVERKRKIQLFCASGVAALNDPYDDHIALYAGEGGRCPEPILRKISTEMPLVRELRAFIGHLKGGPPPRSSFADGFLIVQRLEEMLKL